ncbi:MAG: hypothetical protein ACE368_11820 [Paracoccaceae bacterium]
MNGAEGARDTARMKAVLVLAATLAFVMAPFASDSFGGFEPSLFPVPQDDPPVQPAGYAFSIWGVIYIWLIAHAGYGLFLRSDDPAWDATRWPMIVSLVVGAPWIAVAGMNALAATAMIWVMLGGAVLALMRAAGHGDRWWLAAPIGLYAGWLTAASCVSVGLVGAGWGIVLGALGWAWVALVLALVLALAVLRRTAVPEYGAAVIWALVAVAVANMGSATILALAALAAAAVVVVTLAGMLRQRG